MSSEAMKLLGCGIANSRALSSAGLMKFHSFLLTIKSVLLPPWPKFDTLRIIKGLQFSQTGYTCFFPRVVLKFM